ncbi:MAG: hypothetical protein QF858_03445 [Candidatus Pacebacteria bacterium]|jgi:mannose-6-phosphate isomerase-like protein (cupin superfamily)|nr:hypothetical protein [bacterium]MDP6527903.1 hypothetical protein [Candidatus Paceibacterota bacterium]MDP6659713.1 hypothetical protein [Candidatus Paceibacterota bacterium]|tara:strand:- start:14216 stop:14587 length:372 start_codon:yes stop_codon:yes gene_type:complete
MYKKHKKTEKTVPARIPGFGYWGGTGITPIGISYGEAHEEEEPKDPLHYRKKSRVYFIILKGTLLLEIEGERNECTNEIVYEIFPETPYRVLGSLKGECVWIAINTVNDPEDKVIVEKNGKEK